MMKPAQSPNGGGTKLKRNPTPKAKPSHPVGGSSKPGTPAARRAEDLVWPPELPGPANPNRRVLMSNDMPIEPYDPNAKKEKKAPAVRLDEEGNPMIKVLLQSKPEANATTSSIGTTVSSGVDGLNLQTFSRTSYVWLSRDTMLNCPYFEKMLRKKWKNKTHVELELVSPSIVDAFESVLHVLQVADYSIHEDINESNQFKIYHAANFLGLVSIQEQCEGFIKQHMDEDMFLSAVEEAKALKDANLLDICYTYFKRVGLKPLLMKTAGTPRNTDRRKSSDAIVDESASNYSKKEAGIVKDQSSVTTSNLVFDKQTRELTYNKKRVKIDTFKKILQAEIARKQKYYTVGTFTDEYDEDIEDIDDEEEGYYNMLQCYMIREKEEDPSGKNMQYFSVYSETDDEFLIAARLVEGTGKFILSMDPEDFEPYGHNYIGECSGNLLGTHFSTYDFGMNITRRSNNPLQLMRVEHGLTTYKTNVLGRVPNKMKVVLPRDINAHKHDIAVEGPSTFKKEMLSNLYKRNKKKEIYVLNTKGPIWSKELDAWTMDFRGRVKLPSKKNFQLECPDILYSDTKEPMVLMVFGKIEKHKFALDFRAPLTIVQALGVALSSFADKLVVT